MITGKIFRKLKNNTGNTLINDLLKHTIFDSILSCLLSIFIFLLTAAVYLNCSKNTDCIYLVSLKQSLFFNNTVSQDYNTRIKEVYI